MGSSLAALLLLYASRTTGHVVSAQEEVRELSAQLGRSISLSKPLERNYLYIEPNGATPERQLSAVAVALHASIVTEPNGVRLTRTKKILTELHEARKNRRAEWLKDLLQRRSAFRATRLRGADPRSAFLDELDHNAKQLEDYSAHRATRTDNSSPNDLLPSAPLLDALVQQIGPETLADIPSGEIRVYEDDPIAGALPLPPHESLTEQYNAGMRAMKSLEFTDKEKRELQRTSRTYIIEDWSRRDEPLTRLRLQVAADEGGIQINLEGFSTNGDRLCLNGMLALGVKQLRYFASLVEEDIDPKQLHSAEDEVQLSEPALSAVKPVMGSMPDWELHPDVVEPMDLFVQESVAGLVRTSSPKCVVFNVDDFLWGEIGRSVHEGKLRLNVLRQLMAQNNPYEQVQSPDTVVWRPVDPEIAEMRCADRKVLGIFARKVFAAKHADVRDIALLLHDASEQPSSMVQSWLERVCVAVGQTRYLGSYPPDEWYVLLGGISETDWEKLVDGESLSVGQLGVEQGFERLLSRSRGGTISGSGRVPSIYQHPMELFPSGGYGRCMLSFRTTGTDLLRCWTTEVSEPQGWSADKHASWMDGFPCAFPVNWIGDEPVLTTTKQKFFADMDKQQLRRAKQASLVLIAGLPMGYALQANETLGINVDTHIYCSTQLTPEERDKLWEKSCQYSIAQSRKQFALPEKQGAAPVGANVARSTPPPR